MSVKYRAVGYLSKCCCQCALIVEQGLFEHSCNQVTFRMPLSKKITITVTEVILLKCLFYRFVLNKINKNKHTEYRKTMSSPYHSKVRDLLKTRQSCFSFVWAMDVLFSHIWVKPKFQL